MDPRLYKAATQGDMRLLTSIVEANYPPVPNLTLYLTPQNNTALHIAVEFEQKEIVQRMIQLCPSLISQPNSKGDTPLHVAARAGHLGLTQLLTPALNLAEGNPALEEGNPVRQAGRVALRTSNLEGSNPIHETLKKSHGEVALHLLAFEERHELARRVNKAGESLLYLAAEAGLDKVVQKIIDMRDYNTQGPDGQNPLHIAIIKGRLGVVEILLDKASNLIPQVDGFGNTVLHYASAKSYRRVFEYHRKSLQRPKLLPGHPTAHPTWSQEADQIKILRRLLEANPSLAYLPDKNGNYPLFIAITKGFIAAVDIILDYCPDSIELVNQQGQNALHLAIMEKNESMLGHLLLDRFRVKKLIDEPDNDGNTPTHLATLTDQADIVLLLTDTPVGVDLTMCNKQGHTALDICGYTETEDWMRDRLRRYGAVPSRYRWQERFPDNTFRTITVEISQEYKSAIQTLPVVTVLVATVTFAAAFTVPGGYNNDGPHEGLPFFMRNAALQAFVLSDILAFCSSMVATILLVYVNAHSEDAYLISSALKTCYKFSVVAIVTTMTAFVTAVYVLTSKESLWLAVTSLLLGAVVPFFLYWYRRRLKSRRPRSWNAKYLFKS